MKFIIKRKTHENNSSVLRYLPHEFSFIMEPSRAHEIDCYLLVNYINLTVVDKRIVDLSGFCPYGNWVKFTGDVPTYSTGYLEIVDELEPGFSYRINSCEWPIFFNNTTGWICIGDPSTKNNAVEFLNGSVAALDPNGNLVSLWLKPVDLPI